jgi:hypothetical protein
MYSKSYGRKEKCIGLYILVGKAEGKRLLGRSSRRCEDNIKMDVKEIVWENFGVN